MSLRCCSIIRNVVAILGSVGLAGFAMVACTTTRSDRNASEPPDGGGEALTWLASETSVAFLPPRVVGVDGTLVVAYNDWSGYFQFDPFVLGRMIPRPRPTMAGVSYSTDLGASWNRVGPLPIPSCTGNNCPTALSGDPTLGSNGQQMVYAVMAGTPDSSNLTDGVAVARSLDGVNWDPMRLALRHSPSFLVDKPWLAMLTGSQTAVIAYQLAPLTGTTPGLFSIYTATSTQGGYLGWCAPVPLALETSFDVPSLHNPIVRLRGNLQGYVAYMELNGADRTQFNLRIARLVGSPSVSGCPTWTATTIFSLSSQQIVVGIPGAQSRLWRDDVPVSFDIGNAGRHLYVAFRRDVPGFTEGTLSVAAVADCFDDNPPTSCAVQGGQNVGWRFTNFNDPADPAHFAGDQLQPSIAAGPFSNVVGVTWYQRRATGDTDVAISSQGAASVDGGGAWSITANIVQSGETWDPCPSAQAVEGKLHYYGDYVGSLVIPFPFGGLVGGAGNVVRSEAIVSARTDSRYGCNEGNNGETWDQHVQATVW